MKKYLFILFLSGFSMFSFAQGDSCEASIPMPYNANSILTGITQGATVKWFTFIPLTPEVKIELTNTNMVIGHVQLCYQNILISIGFQ